MRVRTRAPLVAALVALLAALVMLVAGSTTSGGAGAHWLPLPAAGQPSAPASPTPDSPAVLTVLGAGDVLIHPPVWEQAAADAGGTGFDFYGPAIYQAAYERITESLLRRGADQDGLVVRALGS